jgi:hypothetical protein
MMSRGAPVRRGAPLGTQSESCYLHHAVLRESGFLAPVELSFSTDGGSRGQNAARSLAPANPFPADFIPTARDSFAPERQQSWPKSVTRISLPVK